MVMAGPKVAETVAMLGMVVERIEDIELEDVGARPTIAGSVWDIVIRVERVFVNIVEARGETRIVTARIGICGMVDIVADFDFYVS